MSNPFDDPFFKNAQKSMQTDPFFKDTNEFITNAQKTVKRGFIAMIVMWLLGTLFSLAALIGVIWFVIYLLHHYHVFN